MKTKLIKYYVCTLLKPITINRLKSGLLNITICKALFQGVQSFFLKEPPIYIRLN
jgi:hypothetical protein